MPDMTPENTRLAKSYRLHRGGLEIDGRPFPWHAIADPGPTVQRLSENEHILWVPIIIDAVLPPEQEAPR